ncbi:MAG TPA: SRPBCC domain-containing protein [Thermoanaerobaculia bacterium]|nr:SRPBCC domain-containing protein [Thermoanaerobaculia bacterium]
MNTLHFAITIDAPRAAVWKTMIAPETYRLWTADFAQGSYFEGSWAEGERIRFLGPDGSGMVAVIAENRLHEIISIQHLGFVANGVEDTESEAVKAWAPLFETYRFTDAGSATEVQVDMDIWPEHQDYMAETWPKALAKLKALCEAGTVG